MGLIIKLFSYALTFLLLAYLGSFACLFIFGKIDINIGGVVRILMESWEQPFVQFLVIFAIWLALQRKYNKERFDIAVSFLLSLSVKLRRGLLTPSLPDVEYIYASRAGGVGPQAMALVALALLTGILLRIYHLPFIYFPDDSVNHMIMGEATIAANFLVTHSSPSSTGMPHPPMFNYALGLLMTISRDPVAIAGMMSLLNIAALVVFARYMLYSEPLYFALVSIGLLAVNSFLFFYSSIIWHPSLMPVAMMLFHAKLCRFIKGKRTRDLAWAFAFASIAAQFHGSGYLLCPTLAIVALSFRKEAGAKGLALALAAGALLCSPYLYYLLAQGGISDGLNTAVGAKRGFSLRVIANFFSMSGSLLSPRVFSFWLGMGDYNYAIQMGAGPFGRALKMAGYMAEISFAAGLIRYLAMVVSERSFFPDDPSGEKAGRLPVSFQLAGLIVTFASLGYMLFRAPVFPHFLTLMFPSCVILAAWAPFRLCKYAAGKAASFYIIAGNAALGAIIIASINAAGGHYLTYGATYRTMMRIKQDIRRINPQNRPVDLYLESRRSAVIYYDVLKFLISPDGKEDSPGKMPLLLTVTWDKKLKKFEWFVKSLESRPGERDIALQQALALVPPGASLGAYPDIARYVRGRPNTTESRTPGRKGKDEYALADVGYSPYAPPMNHYAIESAQALLRDRRYALIYNSSGILLFKAGAKKTADREEFEKISFTFKAVDMFCGSEADLMRPDSTAGFVRSSSKRLIPSKPYMVCGPYTSLTPGQYTASFRLLAEENARHDNPVAVLDIVSKGASVKLGEKTIKPGDFPKAGQWHDFAVPFTVGPKMAHGVELRILYLGGPQIQADLVSISMDDQTFNATLRH
jgi:hypothetical protein